MNNKKIYLSGVIFVGFLLGYFLKKQYNLLLDYCYLVKKFEIIKLDTNELILKLDILFKNLSKIKYKINNMLLDIYIEDLYLGKIKIDKIETENNEKISNFDTNINIYFDKIKIKDNIYNLSLIISKFLTDKNSLKLKFVISLNLYLFNINIPIMLKNIIIEETYKELTKDSYTNCKI